MARTPGNIVADHNSNSCVDETLDQYWTNKEFGSVPTSIYISSDKDLSYDDLSKNFDANLAEIDMETFRTEDIHSILTLPVMYSGDFQCSNGEQCASMSGSLLSGIDLDSSVAASAPTSSEEEEMFIIKNEPLFSPVHEHSLPNCTISVDSLDCSSMEDHDLVLTCQANKNNYTIVFEGSTTDDSDYLEVGGSSDGEGLAWKSQSVQPITDSMVRSDLPYTTWSKLRRNQDLEPCKEINVPNSSTKSQSLPNLLRHSMIAETFQNGCVKLFDLQTSQYSKDSSYLESPHSLSLLKLYMKQKSISSSESEELSSGAPSLNGNTHPYEANNNMIDFSDNTSQNEQVNSLYLEDSLMDVRLTSQMKEFQPSPIKEEEEPIEGSSGDDTMKCTKSNASLGSARQEGFNIDQVRTKRSNGIQVNSQQEECTFFRRLDMSTNSQGTQTRYPVTETYSSKSKSRDPSPSSSSSGYISSRPSIEKIAGLSFTKTLSCESNRRPSVTIERPCCRSTQIPIHIKDQCVQTSLSEASAVNIQAFKNGPANVNPQKVEDSEMDQDSENTPKRSIYVCYPNYSLPDLSFLKDIGHSRTDDIYLTPTKHLLPQDSVAGPTIKVRRRPKSCTDTEPQSQRPNHIRDWDSLSVLLPEELKNAILRLSLSSDKGPSVSKPLRLSSPSPKRGSTRSSPVCSRNVPKTLLKKSSTMCADKFAANQKSPTSRSKRFSLQEPYNQHYYSDSKPISYYDESIPDNKREKELEDLEWPPQEFVITPSTPVNIASLNADIYQQELNKKTGIVGDLKDAVHKIMQHFEGASTKKEKLRLGNSALTPTLLPKVVQHLCVALEAVLIDGLHTFIPGLFGRTPSSAWKLVEASLKQGRIKKEVNELLHQVSREESSRRLVCFFIGLLNHTCLDWWLGHLCSCESLIQNFHEPAALLRLITLPALSHLRDELQAMVAPLASFPFTLQPPPSPIILTRTKLQPVIDRGEAKTTWDAGVVGNLSLQHHTGGQEPQLWPGVTVYPFVQTKTDPEHKFQKLRQKWEQMSSLPPGTKEIATATPVTKTQRQESQKATKPPISPRKAEHTSGHSSRSQIPRSKAFNNIPERSLTPRRSLIPVHKSTVGRRSSSLGKE